MWTFFGYCMWLNPLGNWKLLYWLNECALLLILGTNVCGLASISVILNLNWGMPSTYRPNTQMIKIQIADYRWFCSVVVYTFIQHTKDLLPRRRCKSPRRLREEVACGINIFQIINLLSEWGSSWKKDLLTQNSRGSKNCGFSSSKGVYLFRQENGFDIYEQRTCSRCWQLTTQLICQH